LSAILAYTPVVVTLVWPSILAWQDDDPLAFVARHGSRIREIHLHDAKKEAATPRPHIRDHMALGQGTIDYQALLRKLQEIGFKGPVILENSTKADLEASLQQLAGSAEGS